MKIYLVKKSFFTFGRRESWDVDLLGKTALTLMRERLGAEIAEESALPDGSKIVLYPCYPFLSLRRLYALVSSRGGSFSFAGGYVARGGGMRRTDLRLPCPLLRPSDLPAVLARAERESASLHARSGALVERGARVDFLSRLGRGAVVRAGARVFRSVIGDGAEISGDSEISESEVGAGTRVRSSYLRSAKVGRDCSVGPFSLLRAGSEVGDGCRVGDFVEIKNSSLGAGSKAAHLAYIGDAELKERVNVGCGVVFANYNGKIKQRSYVGKDCFLGSNCNLIAPVRLGDGAFLAAGTTLTRDLNPDDFCIGRSRESVKEGGAKKYLKSPDGGSFA